MGIEPGTREVRRLTRLATGAFGGPLAGFIVALVGLLFLFIKLAYRES